MNTGMWDHPATVANLDVLRRRGAQIVEAETGDLACGTHGKGRMAEPEQILREIRDVLSGGVARSDHASGRKALAKRRPS
jgi:phosphopantothenoylcysteine decarboxylase/phosphopantothenate--cysteine ligase